MIKKRPFLTIFYLLIPVIVFSETYYVSQTGDDSDSGNIEFPFGTIQKAIDVSSPGDLILVYNGQYVAPKIRNYGGNSNDIRTEIKAYNGRPVINSGNGHFEIYASRYITISGFEFDRTQVIISNGSSNITIDDNNIFNAHYGITINNSSHCLIRRNIIDGNKNGIKGGEVGIRIYSSHYNLVQHNECFNQQYDHQNGDGIGLFKGSSYNIISHNISHDNPDDNLDGWYSGSNNVIQYNTFYRAGFDDNGNRSNGDGKGMKTNYESHHWIIRYNTSYNNAVEGITDEDSGGNNVFFNNTSYNNGINNYGDFIASNHIFLNNVSCGRNANNSLLSSLTGNKYETILANCMNWFVNASNGNFRLQANSPLIDNGIFLSSTNESNSGTVINVENVRFFIDGYGITDGDPVKIGDNNPVRITDVNYAENIITVNENISWNDNDPVSLFFSDSSPDIGAFEYTTNPGVDVPANITIKP